MKPSRTSDITLLQRRWRSLLMQTSLFLGVPVLVVGTAGIHWTTDYLRQQVVPTIARDLSKSLNRPVYLGELEAVSLGYMQLGESAIPPTTADRDGVKIAAVEIRFDPLQSIQTGKVGLDVTLVRPEIVLDEQAPGEWLATEFNFGDDAPFEVRQVRLRDARLRLSPYSSPHSDATLRNGESHHLGNGDQPAKQPPIQANHSQQHNRSLHQWIELEHGSADVVLRDNAKLIAFQAAATLTTGGQLLLKGEVAPEDDFAEVRIQAKEVAIAPLNGLLPADVTAETGEISGDWKLKQVGDRPLDLRGNARIRQGTFWLQGEPNAFSDIAAQLRFAGAQVVIETGFLRFGKIPFHVTGTIHPDTGLDLHAKVDSVSAADFMQTFKLELPFAVTGALRSDHVRVQGEPGKHLVFSGTVHDAQPIQLDRVKLASAHTEFVLEKFDRQSRDRLMLKNLVFNPVGGGRLGATADIWLGDQDEGQEDDIQVAIALKDVPTDAIAQIYGARLPKIFEGADLSIGRLNATGQVTVHQDNPQISVQWQTSGGTFPAQGTLTLEDEILTLQNTHIQMQQGTLALTGRLANGQWQTTLEGKGISLSQFAPQMPGILQVKALLAGDFKQPDLGLVGDASAVVQLPEGQIWATGTVAKGRWQSVVQGDGMPLNQVVSNPAVPTGKLAGALRASGALENFRLAAIAAQASATVHLPAGTVAATADLTAGQWRAKLQSTNLPVSSVVPQLPGLLTGEVSLTGDVDHLSVDAIAAQANATLHTSAGVFQAQAGAIAGNWHATVQTPGLQTAAFLPHLPGQLAGELQLTGSWQDLSPEAVQATGEVRFAAEQGTWLRSPLTAELQWTGERLQINHAKSDGLRIHGWVDAKLTENLRPQITDMDFHIDVSAFNLKTLPLALPGFLNLNGSTDFTGRLTGTPESPQLEGHLQLKQFAVNQLMFEPQLAGAVTFSPQRGVVLNLAGDRDKILLNLDRDFLPQRIFLQTKEARLEGRRRIDWLDKAFHRRTRRTPFSLQVKDLPLETVSLLVGSSLPLHSLSGNVSGAFDLDLAALDDPHLRGWLTLRQPRFGRLEEGAIARHQADFFHSKLNFAGGQLSLTEGALRFGESQFQLAGQFAPQQDAAFSVQLMTQQGNLQDVVTAVRWLQPTARAWPEDVATVRGRFQTQITLCGSRSSPLTAAMNLRGQDWQWRNFTLQTITLANLRLTQDGLTIPKAQLEGLLYRRAKALPTERPLAFRDLALNFSGNLRSHQSTGQLKARNIPIPLVLDLMNNPPLPVDGSVDAIATLSGSVSNPELQGIVNLSNVWAIGVIQIKNELAFRYHNAQLEIR
ncbi:MAG TPA: hypothetical protein IGS37_00245 [Synechococcales cyanobacterium M55_K2018_004]|nr:hypothetical protein [Synechococcales cyanobacterium M55_K2018_004]